MSVRSRLRNIPDETEPKPRKERRRRKGIIKPRTFDATKTPEPHPEGHPIPAWALRVHEVLEEKGPSHRRVRHALRVLRDREERLVDLVDQAWTENKRASLRAFNLEKKIRREGKRAQEKLNERLDAARELVSVTFREYTRAMTLLTRVRNRRRDLRRRLENEKD